MTYGEQIIRPDFAKNDEVRELKRQFVILMDKMAEINKKSYLAGEPVGSEEYLRKNDMARCAGKAADHLEVAAMFAVKALTA